MSNQHDFNIMDNKCFKHTTVLKANTAYIYLIKFN